MYDKLINLMRKFNIQELKEVLGQSIADSLIEWLPDGKNDFSKTEYAKMILCVKGVKILNNKEFRSAIINKFTDDVILQFTDLVKSNKVADIREFIKETPFNQNNNTIRKLLEILEIPENYIWEEKKASSVMNQIESYDKFYELLDYQFLIKQRILNELNSNIDLNRMLVHMPTGTGKTKTTMHTIINYFIRTMKKQGLIIWIAHTKELLEQAYDTFCSVWKHLGQEFVNVYKFWGDSSLTFDKEINGIVFCSIQKLSAIDKTNTFLNLKSKIKLIIFDEAHKAAANDTRKIIESLMIKKEGMCNRNLIGLTATPGRTTLNSDENLLLASMFGNKLISIDTGLLNKINMSKVQAQFVKEEKDIIKYFQNRKILSKIRKEELEYEAIFDDKELKILQKMINLSTDEDYSMQALQILGANRSRNKTILKRLRELYVEKIPTIVFGCSVEHCRLLSSILSIEGIDNSLVISDMKPNEREDAIRRFKQNEVSIIVNWGVLTTGFDSTNIRCVFIARPTKSVVLYSQMIGRGLRGPEMGGSEECLLIDVKDNLQSFNENKAFNHFQNYWRN